MKAVKVQARLQLNLENLWRTKPALKEREEVLSLFQLMFCCWLSEEEGCVGGISWCGWSSGISSEGKDSSQGRNGGTDGQPCECNGEGASYHGGVGTGLFDQGWTRLGSSHGERGGSRAEGWSEVKPEVWIVLIAGALHQEQLVGLEAGYESTGRKKGLVTRDSEGNVLMRSFWGINFIIFRFWNLCTFPRTLFRKKKEFYQSQLLQNKTDITKNFFSTQRARIVYILLALFLVHLGDRHFNSVKFAFPWQINNRCRLWTDLLKS